MAKPKLALIPATQGSKLYSVLPADGLGDFNFSRNTVATRINKDGLIETVASGVSRLNYPLIDGVVNGCPSHLLEPSRSNLIPYSEDFSNASWEKTNITVPSSRVISPDGTLNADKLERTSTGGYLKTDVSTSGEQSYTVFLKKGDLNFGRILARGTGNPNVYFDLNNGTVGTETNAIGSIEYYGNGWYRCNIVYDVIISSVRIYVTENDDSTVGINGYIYSFGAQLEQGSYPTSYIPNYGTSAGITRSAETANGAGDASTFNDSEGVLMLESKGFSDLQTSSSYIQLSKNGESSSTNSLIIQHRNNGSLRIYANGFAIANIIFNLNIDFTQNHKIAVLYKLNSYRLFIDGFEQSLFGTPTQAVFSGLDNLAFDLRGILGWNSQIKQLQYFDLALAGTQIEQLTSWTSFRDMAEAQSYTIQ